MSDPRSKIPRPVCSACGTQASCDCHAEYIPAGEYARRVADQHPDWSNRRIAAEYGMARATVNRIRGDTNVSPESEPAVMAGADDDVLRADTGGSNEPPESEPENPKPNRVLAEDERYSPEKVRADKDITALLIDKRIGKDGKEYPALKPVPTAAVVTVDTEVAHQREIRAVIAALTKCSQEQRYYLWTKIFPQYRYHKFFSRRPPT